MKQQNNQQQESFFNSPQIKNWIFWMMMFVIIVLCFYLIWKVNDGSIKCMANPLSYGVSKLESSNGNPITCICSFQGSEQIIYVNKFNVTYLDKGFSLP